MSLRLLFLLASAGLLASCASSTRNAEMDAQRRAAIAAEPRGNYYVRRPGESWDKARLVCVNERYCKIPDRLPEQPASGPAYGYDHNYEYHFTGEFSGRKVFDPNSNMVLPEFVLKSHKLVNQNPGYLFRPNERFNGSQLLRGEPGAVP
jgi:hypothetical protein